MNDLINKINNRSLAEKVNSLFFLVLTIWWGILYFKYDSELESANLYWAASYQLVAIWGVIWGIHISRYWGGMRSVMGRSIAFFTIGLFLQVFGQSVFSFYNLVLQVEIPYPSLADVGYFGSIPFYILGALSLGKVAGIHISLKSFINKIQTLVIPVLMVSLSYFFFLKDYAIESNPPLQVFLDLAYPIGQAIYVSIAILVYLLSKNVLGGVMKNKILILLLALVVQYVADYNFLYQAGQGTWINGGYGDYLYLVSYFLMTYSLIKIGSIFHTREVQQ